MDNHEHLEELDPSPAATPAATAAPAAAATTAGQSGAPSGQPYPQFMRFLAGGMIVLVGCLLPFGSKLTTTMVPPATLESRSTAASAGKSAGQELAESMRSNTPIPAAAPVVERGLPSMMGIETFTGALWLLFALALISSMRQCLRDNKIRLKSVMIMLIPCGWAWVKLFEVVPTIEGFDWGTVFKIRMLEHLAQNVGSGFLLVLLGSTYVSINFIMAIVGAFTSGGKKADADSTAGTKSAARRRG